MLYSSTYPHRNRKQSKSKFALGHYFKFESIWLWRTQSLPIKSFRLAVQQNSDRGCQLPVFYSSVQCSGEYTRMSPGSKVLKEVASMLYWTMLAACTVGPGTVVTCARAGAEFGLNLIWALVVASLIAFTLQEGTARLTIVSGQSLGQCIKTKYQHMAKIYNTAIICWLLAGSVFFGNMLYECNNFAGGVDAVMAMPGASDLTGSSLVGLRVGSCLVYAILALGLLYWDKTDKLGIMLGLLMIGMVTLFLVVVVYMGMEWTKFLWGLLPNLPAKTESSAEPADIIISLVSTTSVGYNLFLGGAMAKGRELGSAQRGIAFSTVSAVAVSILILIVGSGFHQEGGSTTFTISQLSEFIKQFLGTAGVVVFSLGFIAAALSSILTCPLAAALTADSVLTFKKEEKEEDKESPSEDKNDREMPRLFFLGLMLVMVLLSTVVISANADRTLVILIAQVFNGCLLPLFSTCLLLCLNDKQFMVSSPQSGLANIAMLICVTLTFIFTANVLLQKLVGSFLTDVYIRLGVAIGLGVAGIGSVCVATTLGREIVTSFRKSS
eukprot:GFUD01004093.1.p1 GENE.GFUD01004093.1~~GFUD01004093.1.p1  ORF type:complete len:552 (-),score=122.95 GFUD01004093.1:17-1672(-)